MFDFKNCAVKSKRYYVNFLEESNTKAIKLSQNKLR